VVLGARPRSKSTLVKVQPKKLFRVDSHICIAATGLMFDANLLVDCARKICMSHRSKFSSAIPIETLADELSSLLHQQTRSAGTRPLGVGLIIAGIDDVIGPQVVTKGVM